jgi:hypothetical protein
LGNSSKYRIRTGFVTATEIDSKLFDEIRDNEPDPLECAEIQSRIEETNTAYRVNLTYLGILMMKFLRTPGLTKPPAQAFWLKNVENPRRTHLENTDTKGNPEAFQQTRLREIVGGFKIENNS